MTIEGSSVCDEDVDRCDNMGLTCKGCISERDFDEVGYLGLVKETEPR